MDNLLQTIKALYLQISDRDLLRLVMCQRDSRNVFMPIDGVLIRMLQNNLPSYTIDQIENVKAFLRGSWMKGSDDSLESLMYSPKQTPLNVLLSFASKALHVNQGKPICQYDGLMRWHTITSVISEDTVTTAFLTSYDLKKNIDRVNFDWEPVISHDNKDVNSVTSREVTELHNHLFGSSLSVELNWLSVMNNNVNNPQKYKYFSTNLRQQSLASDYSGETNLYTRIVKAAAIRLYLFCKTNKTPKVNRRRHRQFNNQLRHRIRKHRKPLLNRFLNPNLTMKRVVTNVRNHWKCIVKLAPSPRRSNTSLNI